MVLWDISPPSSWSAGFLNKVAIPSPNNVSLNLLACHMASSTSLDLVTTPEHSPQWKVLESLSRVSEWAKRWCEGPDVSSVQVLSEESLLLFMNARQGSDQGICPV